MRLFSLLLLLSMGASPAFADEPAIYLQPHGEMAQMVVYAAPPLSNRKTGVERRMLKRSAITSGVAYLALNIVYMCLNRRRGG